MALDDITMADVLLKNELIHADGTAFAWGSERRTFRDYAQDVQHLAAGLAALGLVKGDRIAVVALNCYEYFVLYGAAAWMGAILVPINWRLKSEEIRTLLSDCTPVMVVVSPDYTTMLTELLIDCACVRYRIVIGSEQDGFRPLWSLSIHEQPDEFADVGEDAAFVIIYTAAVEGRPRGAVLTQRNILACALQAIIPMAIGSHDVYINLMPLFHVMGLELAMATMMAGGTNVIMSKFDGHEAVLCIEQRRATVIPVVPPMLSTILDEAEAMGSGLQTLRVVAGLFDRSDTVERCQRITDARFWVGYGQTETSGYVTLCPYDERPGSSGKEGPMARLRVVDEYDRQVEKGHAGEIVLKGPLVFKQYWNLEDDTAYTLREGWHHTGDIGRFDEQGYLWYVRRKPEKELIKPGGENVYPAEVEKALLEHKDVLEACVFGVPDEQWGEAVKAACVRRAGSGLTEQELVDFVGSRIARYKKPKYVAFVEELPKREDGALDRERIKSQA
jgi:long-chain acyl-CoA synthetase